MADVNKLVKHVSRIEPDSRFAAIHVMKEDGVVTVSQLGLDIFLDTASVSELVDALKKIANA